MFDLNSFIFLRESSYNTDPRVYHWIKSVQSYLVIKLQYYLYLATNCMPVIVSLGNPLLIVKTKSRPNPHPVFHGALQCDPNLSSNLFSGCFPNGNPWDNPIEMTHCRSPLPSSLSVLFLTRSTLSSSSPDPTFSCKNSHFLLKA